ncbi:VPA1262 family N-terminal domain-containing protein [Acidithiobacillus sp. IBUN Pt1247-S3]|uniref:VPA1262 family N-terminal domain-containing protein n=1 Tax=Acidithiobacillus sp. IBUN Pt1247-S3 TaxID=3166642 RepID=UPI0034E47BA1
MDSYEDSNTVAQHINHTISAQQDEKWCKVATDYHGALVRVATMRTSQIQHLLFGYVELFPHDIPVPESFRAGEKPWRVPNSRDSMTLSFSSVRMSVADALTWYEEAAQGRVTIPGTASPVSLVAPPFGFEPSLGHFSIGDNVPPFAAQWHGRPRIHRLVPMEPAVEVVQNLRSSSPAREWLAANTGFDPLDYEEWLGSLSLLAPDPLLESVHYLPPEGNPDGSERVTFQVRRRHYEDYPDAEADALNFVLLKRRPSGWTEILPTPLDTDGFVIKDYPEPVREVGYAISCPVRGLLRMAPPASFIRQIGINFSIVNTAVNVEVPAGGRRKPATNYRTHRASESRGVHVGEALPISGAVQIVKLQEARKVRVQRQSAPQRLFGSHDSDELTGEDLVRMRGEAVEYVAGLVAVAQRQVIFVDPDFGVREFQNYALRVTRDSVAVKILTGAPHMRKARPSDNVTDASAEMQPAPSAAPGVLLLNQLQHVQSQLGRGAPEVFVMPGSRKPIFHDRFLVIDDVVWALGPSFNELGERIGIISQVHAPCNVIAAVERVIARAKPLAEWVAETQNGQPNGDGHDATIV